MRVPRLICPECHSVVGAVMMSRHYGAHHPHSAYPLVAIQNQRFLQSVEWAAEGECWDWTGIVDEDGYGKFSANDKSYRAHRWSYALFFGEEIPSDLVTDHLCRNRKCVNPRHLEAVTNGVNVLRGDGLAARLAKVTHCPQGHEYTEENTYRAPSSPRNRSCLTCRRARTRASNAARNKEEFNAYRRERRKLGFP